jgi:hypothetical protein
MRKILNFEQFINEATFPITNPAKAGQELSSILGQTRNVKEQPSGSNRGTEVDAFLKSVGLDPSDNLPWCQAYVYWVLEQLSKKLGISNPAPKVGSVKKHWDKSPTENKINISNARNKPDLVRPGMVFIAERGTPWSKGGIYGHTGIVLSVDPANKKFVAIEGNTDEKATGEGDKVGINTRSLTDSKLVGFIDWFKDKRNDEFEKALSGGKFSPTLRNDDGGKISGGFLTTNNTMPDQSTVGDPEKDAWTFAANADDEEDHSLVAMLMKPMNASSKNTVITKGQVRKFLGKKSYKEEYNDRFAAAQQDNPQN